METISSLRDGDIGESEYFNATYDSRSAARAVVVRGGKIALLNVTKKNFYKLPGGGIDSGETVEEGLRREVLEEAGCTIEIAGEIGKVVEYRSKAGLQQTSFCYLAKTVKEGEPSYMKDEIEDGFQLIWVGIDEAIELVGKSKPNQYDEKFMVKRDLAILSKAKGMVQNLGS